MGAWGVKVFEDDSALDWYATFCEEEQSSIKALNDAFRTVIQEDDYIESDDCSYALAAAEVLTAAFNYRSDNFPDKEPNFTKIQKATTPKIVEQSVKAVEKVRNFEHSELRQLWEESEHYEEWINVIKDLVTRLNKVKVEISKSR